MAKKIENKKEISVMVSFKANKKLKEEFVSLAKKNNHKMKSIFINAMVDYVK